MNADRIARIRAMLESAFGTDFGHLAFPGFKESAVFRVLCNAPSGRYFNFNGTAGIWRRRAIGDAGGWRHDTLTEDTDLSYRAQLRGWRFVYLNDVVSPAERVRKLR